MKRSIRHLLLLRALTAERSSPPDGAGVPSLSSAAETAEEAGTAAEAWLTYFGRGARRGLAPQRKRRRAHPLPAAETSESTLRHQGERRLEKLQRIGRQFRIRGGGRLLLSAERAVVVYWRGRLQPFRREATWLVLLHRPGAGPFNLVEFTTENAGNKRLETYRVTGGVGFDLSRRIALRPGSTTRRPTTRSTGISDTSIRSWRWSSVRG